MTIPDSNRQHRNARDWDGTFRQTGDTYRGHASQNGEIFGKTIDSVHSHVKESIQAPLERGLAAGIDLLDAHAKLAMAASEPARSGIKQLLFAGIGLFCSALAVAGFVTALLVWLVVTKLDPAHVPIVLGCCIAVTIGGVIACAIYLRSVAGVIQSGISQTITELRRSVTGSNS